MSFNNLMPELGGELIDARDRFETRRQLATHTTEDLGRQALAPIFYIAEVEKDYLVEKVGSNKIIADIENSISPIIVVIKNAGYAEEAKVLVEECIQHGLDGSMDNEEIRMHVLNRLQTINEALYHRITTPRPPIISTKLF